VPPKNLAAVLGPVQDYDIPDTKEGHWDHVDCDELPDGIHRCVDMVEILVVIICVFGRYTFYQPREIKLWSCCGGRHAFPSHKQSLDYLHQHCRTLGEEIGCEPYNVAIGLWKKWLPVRRISNHVLTLRQSHTPSSSLSGLNTALLSWRAQLGLNNCISFCTATILKRLAAPTGPRAVSPVRKEFHSNQKDLPFIGMIPHLFLSLELVSV
jgi:hypothetical protein